MIIDTHSHLNFKAYDKDREEAIKRTKNADVVCIDVGTKYETSVNVIELAKKNENIFCAIGLHPIHIKSDLLKIKMDESEGGFAPLGEDFNYDNYKQLILDDKKGGKSKIVAIGEVGLDYYYKPKATGKKEQFKAKQKQVFARQLDLAEEFDLPVIIHCRMAHNDVIEILKSRLKTLKSNLTGVIHCFTGDIEEANEYINLGFLIGINGIIFKNDLEEAIKGVPLEKIILETDCPYLTPPQAGVERNEPIFVKYVAEKVAEIKGISFDEVVEQTTENAKKLFRI